VDPHGNITYHSLPPQNGSQTPGTNTTIGYGHLIKPGENFDKGITKEQATALLAEARFVP
jgi:hypothetical protein